MEQRCIANDVAYASLHNQHLGKQHIRRGKEDGNGSKMLYPHISVFEASFWMERNTADLFLFDAAAGLHLQVLLSMKRRGARSRLRCELACNVGDLKKPGQNKRKVTRARPRT